MKRIIIDTNGLISFVTDRNLRQQEGMARLFQEASALKCVIQCHHHVISEFVYVLQSVYDVENTLIHGMITDFVSMPGVEISNAVNMSTLLQYWPSSTADYGDAVILSQCRHSKGSAIATFDRQLKNMADSLGLPTLDL